MIKEALDDQLCLIRIGTFQCNVEVPANTLYGDVLRRSTAIFGQQVLAARDRLDADSLASINGA